MNINMDLDDLKLILSIIVVCLGWWCVHYLNTKRDEQNKRKEICLTYLIEAYMLLTHKISHRELDKQSDIVKKYILKNINEVKKYPIKELLFKRNEKFLNITSN